MHGTNDAINPRTLAAGAMENHFRIAADAISNYIRNGNPQTTGAAEFAILHLVSRSLNDLGWGQYLASSGYPIQAYSMIRPVIESLNLVDLFVEEPEAAERWAEGRWQEFMPAKVRERLGTDRDPLYEVLSEHSHPRFAGLQLTAFLRQADQPPEGEPQQAILFMGEIPFDVPAVLLATTLPGVILARAALATAHVRLVRAVWEWAAVMRQVSEELGAGWAEVDAHLPSGETEDGEIIQPLRFIHAIAEELRVTAEAAEAEVAEARANEGEGV
jgi:hypothetical protein